MLCEFFRSPVFTIDSDDVAIAGWHELRLRRVMLKEHIDRIVGIDEELIAEMRSDREVAEEALMMDEVQCLGRVLEVGQTGRGLIPHVPVVVISPEK